MKRRRAGAATVGREAHGSGVVESNIRVYIRTRPSATVQGETCISLDPEHSRLTLNPNGGGARAGTPVRSREGGTPRGVGTPRAGGVSTPRGNGGGPDSFHFEDGVLPEDVTQDQVFERVGRPAAEAVLAGFNVTVFAYGQTGAGKTHTVYGDGGGGDRSAELGGEELVEGDTGLTGRVMELMLAEGKAGADGEECIASRFALSLLDIYDEKVTDLFDPPREKKVREAPDGVYVEGVEWRPLLTTAQGLARLRDGLKGRHVCSTKMNSVSSRSHTICQLRASRDYPQPSGEVVTRTGVLTVVDLCGSERVKKSAVGGARLKEAININTSLSALKTVIESIGAGAGHVPYRSSKLTWLLKDCIGGNARVAVMAHINPAGSHHFETLSTLRFVSMVKTVKTRSSKNERLKSEEERAEDSAVAAALEAEARRLLALEGAVAPAGRPACVDMATQVSPARAAGGGLWEAKTALRELRALADAGEIAPREYRRARSRALATWFPESVWGGAPGEPAQGEWSDASDEEERAGDKEGWDAASAGSAERRRQEGAGALGLAVTLHVAVPAVRAAGAGEDAGAQHSVLELCVRRTALLGTVAAVVASSVAGAGGGAEAPQLARDESGAAPLEHALSVDAAGLEDGTRLRAVFLGGEEGRL